MEGCPIEAEWVACCAGPEGRPCTFVGGIPNGHLQDGRLVSEGTPVASVRQGVVDFTQPPDPWGDWLQSEWIERNWQGGHRPVTDDERDAGARFTRELAAVDGPICEVAEPRDRRRRGTVTAAPRPASRG